MSTDLTRSAQQALQGYSGRWSCEVGNFYLKTQLGLSDFRVRAYQAVDKYLVVVLLTWAYVERRFEHERRHPDQDLRRPHPAASGRTCSRVADQRNRDDARDWRSTASLTPLFAFGNLACLGPVCRPGSRLAGRKWLLKPSVHCAPAIALPGIDVFSF